MSHTDEVLAEIVAANERVCQTRSAMNLAKAEASARSKAYAEAVDNLSLTIPGASSATPLFDQAEPGQEEPPEPDQVPPAGVCRVCGCTEENPCPGGCGWTDKTRTICTRCANGEPGRGELDYFPPFKDGEPAIRSEAEADQEIYEEVKPHPRRRSRSRKTGRKVTKKRSKTDAK